MVVNPGALQHVVVGFFVTLTSWAYFGWVMAFAVEFRKRREPVVKEFDCSEVLHS